MDHTQTLAVIFLGLRYSLENALSWKDDDSKSSTRERTMWTYTNPQPEDKFLSLLCSKVRKRTTHEINSGYVFVIMAGTTPHVRYKDQISVICKYMYVDKDGVLRMRLTDVKEVWEKTGAGLAACAIALVDSKDLVNEGNRLSRVWFYEQHVGMTEGRAGQSLPSHSLE